MTRVAVDLLFMTGRRGGMETYVREVYSRLSSSMPDVDFYGIASSELVQSGAPWFPGDIIDSGVTSGSRVAWATAELTAVGRRAAGLGADLLHCPANVGPVRGHVRTVLTLHDVLAHRHPRYVPGAHAPIVRAMVRGAARHASRVITVSEASADDIHTLLGVERERIDVIPLASSQSGRGVGDGLDLASSRERRVLVVGNRMPHKNVETLVRGLALIPTDRRPIMTITGSSPEDPLLPLIRSLGVGHQIDLRGWLSDSELDELYARSAVVAQPTLFEGFGLPVLEAMSRGAVVLCSDIPVLREVAGDAARYVDPHDPRDMANALLAVLDDGALQERLRELGLRRAALFSWEATARRTGEALYRTLA